MVGHRNAGGLGRGGQGWGARGSAAERWAQAAAVDCVGRRPLEAIQGNPDAVGVNLSQQKSSGGQLQTDLDKEKLVKTLHGCVML